MKTPEELEKLAAESIANDDYLHEMSEDEKYHHRRGFIFGYQKAESQKSAIPIVSPRDHEFRTALILLRDLADIQNGAPLVTVEKEWKEIMDSTYDFLEQHEG